MWLTAAARIDSYVSDCASAFPNSTSRSISAARRRRLAQFRRCRQRVFASLVALPDKVEDEHAGENDEPGQQLEPHAALDLLRELQQRGRSAAR